jgi:hypothetical protein
MTRHTGAPAVSPGYALDVTQTHHVQQDPVKALQNCTALLSPLFERWRDRPEA